MKPPPSNPASSSSSTLFAVLYAIAFLLAFHVSYLPITFAQSRSPIWPVTALVLAALLLRPRREWAHLLGLSAVLAMAYVHWFMELGWRAAVPTIFLNIVQVAVTAWLVERICRRKVTFHRIDDVVTLIVATAVVNAVMGPLVAPFMAQDVSVAVYLRNRWISHGLSMLILTPLCVSWCAVPLSPMPSGRRRLEIAGVVALTFAACELAFRRHFENMTVLPAAYLAFIPVIVGALRFGPRGASAALLVVAIYATLAIRDNETWAPIYNVLNRVAVTQLFLSVAAITGLLLAASREERRASAEGLRKSEQQLLGMFEASMNPIAVCRGDRIAMANPAFLQLVGGPQVDEVMGRPLFAFIAPEHHELVRPLFESADRHPRSRTVEIVAVGAHGNTFPAELRCAPFEQDGESLTIVGARDLTQTKQAAQAIERVNRVLRTVSGCNAALVRATSEVDLLNTICRSVAASEGFVMAWAGLFESDRQSIRVIATAGADPNRAAQVAGKYPQAAGNLAGLHGLPTPPSAKPTVRRYPHRDEARLYGYASVLELPLASGGSSIGLLCFYSDDADAFAADVVKLLQELADNAAFGIVSLRVREQQAIAEASVRRLLEEADKARSTLLSILEDRQLAEQGRRQSEERYRDAMFKSAIGMALLAPDGHCLEVNPALCKIVGYDRDEMLQGTFQSLIFPDDLALDSAKRKELLDAAHESYEIELRCRQRNGGLSWIRANVSLVRDPKDAPLHFIAQIQDISARKRAEESLAATHERLAVALRASRSGIWRHNLQTEAVEWDARMYEIFGLPLAAEAPPPELIAAQIVAEDQARVRRSWQALPSCPHAYEIRFRILRQDGEIRHVDLHGIVHDDPTGRPEWAIGVASDVTEIVEATTESERLRTQLQHAQKMEALGTLAAGVAHDFNNLLTGINGFMELASQTVGPGHEAAQLLEQAKRGAKSARELVRSILTFARADRQSPRLAVDLCDVVRDTAPLIVAALPANISLNLAIQADRAPVVADAGQIQQVLMNLCTNSAHAIDNAAGRIEIGIGLSDVDAAGSARMNLKCEPGRYVRLSIQDNGGGMSENTRRRMFELFFTTKARGVGTGLGLAIVSDIVKAHHGGIEVTSALGRGTTFDIYLPTPGGSTAPFAAVRLPQQSARKAERVLVVDDDGAIATVLAAMLKKLGHRPEVYRSAAEALGKFSTGDAAFALAIVDQNMPGINGSELVGQLHRRTPELPIIFMSGDYASSSAQPDGRTWHLRKPFDVTELIAIVSSVLAPEAAPRAPDAN